MNRTIKLGLALAGLLFGLVLTPAGARAQNSTDILRTGNDFLRQCDQGKIDTEISATQFARCVGYIQGFLEGQTASDALTAYYSNASVKPFYCYPKDAELGQGARVVLFWLNENPAKSNLPISIITEKAFIDAFPCKQ